MAFLPENNLAYPVLIAIGKTTGSGFYFNTKEATYLVTAKHVLFDKGIELIGSKAELTSLDKDLKGTIVINIDCEKLFDAGALKKHARRDVAVCKLGNAEEIKGVGSVMNMLDGVHHETQGRANLLGLAEKNVTLFADAGVSNEVFLFSYPTSLGREAQLDRKQPLLRRGIIAGKSTDRHIVLDCPVYFGNSGGLVLEVNQKETGNYTFRGIGIAVQMVPFVEELWSKQYLTQTGVRYENSGYSLVEPMDYVLELL